MNVAAAAAGVLTCSSAVLKTLQYIQHCSLITIIKMMFYNLHNFKGIEASRDYFVCRRNSHCGFRMT
ncbi:CLUMA_CG006810, isoform A [Clunio marinus]|uniref:CLUMA_CG006810, isoform A n=1 Tax=Clunio marinus TaxID=568069 RepID=A0A1J1HZ83_9DIPT|nr:CLUMA_CG006810, isoform A [Clunio marinus]